MRRFARRLVRIRTRARQPIGDLAHSNLSGAQTDSKRGPKGHSFQRNPELMSRFCSLDLSCAFRSGRDRRRGRMQMATPASGAGVPNPDLPLRTGPRQTGSNTGRPRETPLPFRVSVCRRLAGTVTSSSPILSVILSGHGDERDRKMFKGRSAACGLAEARKAG
jgi:hypothetical protein